MRQLSLRPKGLGSALIETLRMYSHGHGTAEICTALCLSTDTIKTRASRINTCFCVNSLWGSIGRGASARIVKPTDDEIIAFSSLALNDITPEQKFWFTWMADGVSLVQLCKAFDVSKDMVDYPLSRAYQTLRVGTNYKSAGRHAIARLVWSGTIEPTHILTSYQIAFLQEITNGYTPQQAAQKMLPVLESAGVEMLLKLCMLKLGQSVSLVHMITRAILDGWVKLPEPCEHYRLQVHALTTKETNLLQLLMYDKQPAGTKSTWYESQRPASQLLAQLQHKFGANHTAHLVGCALAGGFRPHNSPY